MSESGDVDWDVAGKLAASQHRLTIALAIQTNTPATPTRLTQDTGLDKSRVSTVLGELVEWGVVECLNPGARKGKLFALTDRGEGVVGVAVEATNSDTNESI